jgi:hypothetical protein
MAWLQLEVGLEGELFMLHEDLLHRLNWANLI